LLKLVLLSHISKDRNGPGYLAVYF